MKKNCQKFRKTFTNEAPRVDFLGGKKPLSMQWRRLLAIFSFKSILQNKS